MYRKICSPNIGFPVKIILIYLETNPMMNFQFGTVTYPRMLEFRMLSQPKFLQDMEDLRLKMEWECKLHIGNIYSKIWNIIWPHYCWTIPKPNQESQREKFMRFDENMYENPREWDEMGISESRQVKSGTTTKWEGATPKSACLGYGLIGSNWRIPPKKYVGGFCDGIQTLEFGGCESSIFATHPHFSSLIISYVPRCTRTVTSLQLKEGAAFELERK